MMEHKASPSSAPETASEEEHELAAWTRWPLTRAEEPIDGTISGVTPDLTALSPWVDDAPKGAGENARANDDGAEGGQGTVKRALSAFDFAGTAREAITAGETSGNTIAQLARNLGHHAGHATAGDVGITSILSPLAIAGGMWEMAEGYEKAVHGEDEIDKGEGWVGMVSGLSGIGSGAAGLAALAGSPVGALMGPVLGSFGMGVAIGSYGSDVVKERGWLKGDEGESLKPSEWSSNNGVHANEAVEEHSHGLLGRNGKLNGLAPVVPGVGLARDAGLLATAGSSIIGAGTALVGAIVGGSESDDILMHPEKYRQVDGSPVDEAMKHFNRCRADKLERGDDR